ncbi:hypothetical protein LCGC14_2875050 [marine sediment metagenome]|uniref:Uncharacterized protein n=1 Tax=marine sediment metagenome TaxID=412755 RepID=A0A0F9ASY0_9ZZZZ
MVYYIEYNDLQINKKVLKEDLYNNLKTLMETGRIIILNDFEIKDSIESMGFNMKDYL